MISDDNPGGTDIRRDISATSAYSKIKDTRNAARAAERKNIFDSDKSEADTHWRIVLELAPEILRKHTKDLEIACWYTEALVRHYGFQGLRDGFLLILGLLENYWDHLYPLPDEDGIETRVAPLTGLNGEGAEGVLISPIRNIDITQGSEPGPFSFWKYQQALEIEKNIDDESKKQKAEKLGFSVDDVDQAVSESSEEFFTHLRDDISDSLKAYREIGILLGEYCGINNSPPTSNIINSLDDCRGAITYLGKYKFPADEAEKIDTGESGLSDETTIIASQKYGSVKSRSDAFKKLTEISDFFRQTEPHSPISYILERAVKWGDMPLDDLIKELIPDSSARDFYGSLTGIKTEDD